MLVVTLVLSPIKDIGDKSVDGSLVQRLEAIDSK